MLAHWSSPAEISCSYSPKVRISSAATVIYNARQPSQVDDAYDSIHALGQNLIEEWSPFGDYQDNGWREEFLVQTNIFKEGAENIDRNANHARSLFRKLWEIKKQVELTQNVKGVSSSEYVVTRIEKIGNLLEKGLITKEEFDEKKAKLLDEI